MLKNHSPETQVFSKESFILISRELCSTYQMKFTSSFDGPAIIAIHHCNHFPMLIDLDRVMPGKLGKGKRSAGIFKLMGKLMPPNHGIGSGRLIPRSDGNRIGISIGSGAARNDGIGIGIGKSMGSETA